MDAETLAYNKRQYEQTYGSTIEFAEFIRPLMQGTKNVIDLGCGAGAPTKYLALTFPEAELFLGIDKDPDLIEMASKEAVPRTAFIQGDLFNLPSLHPDAVISLQTFSWLPEIMKPLFEICTKLKPQWLAFSSLFYDGAISCDIIVKEPMVPRKAFYNIYSIPAVTAFIGYHGYDPVEIRRFGKGENLQPMPKPENKDAMRSYTIDAGEDRMIFSGPLYLPWYFLSYRKRT